MKEDEEADDRKINEEKVQEFKLWGIFLFGLIGATATTFAVSSTPSLFFSFSISFYYHQNILS